MTKMQVRPGLVVDMTKAQCKAWTDVQTRYTVWPAKRLRRPYMWLVGQDLVLLVPRTTDLGDLQYGFSVKP